jgi:CubicO group peptidase (beta-lactamase class C family)
MKKTCIVDERFSHICDVINTKLIETATPSLAIAVAQDGVILWEEAFGWADRERMALANVNTMYSLASISKPITATGIMILKERGLIDLDKPINNYLGEAKLKAYVGNAEDATVRRILNHTSGLPLHYHFFYEDEPYPKPPMDETIRRYGNLVTAPGERYQYSNLGYGVLDYVISRVSGRSYEDFMRTAVFLPLDMTHSSVHIDNGLKKYQAIRYDTDGLKIPFYDFDHPGGSAIYNSVHDLIRFGMFHLKAHLPNQKAILSDEAIDDMKVGTFEIGKGNYYGVGWASCIDSNGYRAVWHNGGMSGVSTALMLIPDEKIAVAVLANSASPLPDMIYKDILSALLPKYAENRAIREANQKSERNQQPTDFIPSSELIGEWNGNVHTYKGDIPITFWFKECGDIVVKMGDQFKTLLNDPIFRDDYLTGLMTGEVNTEDSNRRHYHLSLTMKLRDQVLNGSLTAVSNIGKRGNALSHWIEITKKGV